MEEIEIITSEDNKKKINTLSIAELENYEKELGIMIEIIKKEIVKRKKERSNAEMLFKK